MSKPFDLSKSLAALDQDSTLIVVIELSQSVRLVAARAPGFGARSAEEAAAESGTAVQIDRALARGVAAGRTRGAAGLRHFRGGARTVLARAVAPPARDRDMSFTPRASR